MTIFQSLVDAVAEAHCTAHKVCRPGTDPDRYMTARAACSNAERALREHCENEERADRQVQAIVSGLRQVVS